MPESAITVAGGRLVHYRSQVRLRLRGPGSGGTAGQVELGVEAPGLQLALAGPVASDPLPLGLPHDDVDVEVVITLRWGEQVIDAQVVEATAELGDGSGADPLEDPGAARRG